MITRRWKEPRHGSVVFPPINPYRSRLTQIIAEVVYGMLTVTCDNRNI